MGGAKLGPYEPGLTADEMGVAEVVDAVELEPRRPDLETSNAATVGRAVAGRCLSLCMLVLVLSIDPDLGIGRSRLLREGRFFSEWVDRCEEVACIEWWREGFCSLSDSLLSAACLPEPQKGGAGLGNGRDAESSRV